MFQYGILVHQFNNFAQQCNVEQSGANIRALTQDVMHSKFTWPQVLKAGANINKLLWLLYTRCSPHSWNTFFLSEIS